MGQDRYVQSYSLPSRKQARAGRRVYVCGGTGGGRAWLGVSHPQDEPESEQGAHLRRKATTGEAARGLRKLGKVQGPERSLSRGPAIAPHEIPRSEDKCVPGESDALRGTPGSGTPSSAYD